MNDLTDYDYDIFLSHNHVDQEWTTKLAERLETEDWQGRKLRVFFSPWDIRPGQLIPREIENALPRSRKVGIILSPDAMKSAWVELERLVITYIDVSARNERLIPLYRRECDLPPLLRPILYIDFRGDTGFEVNYQKLLAVLRDEPLPRRSQQSVEPAMRLSQIPRPPSVGFVARRDSDGHDIVERLQKELSPEKNQLIVLSGPGGVGKTTLAAEAARRLSNDRIVWISALGREEFSLSTLLDEIATQMGHPGLRTLAPNARAEQVQELIAATIPLIILDNFETISSAEQTHCVKFLLNRASCPALITTRQRITGARNITIPVMLPEEANEFLSRLIKESSDSAAFAEIDRDRVMQASDRIPLVMQWVIGQIDLAQEADTVLDELTQGGGDAAQTVFDRSFGLEYLGDDGRAALLALSLFAPDASRRALAEVAGFDEDLQRLNEAVKRLAALWLVKTTAGRQRLTVEGLTRELAKSHLTKDEQADEYRRRFVAHFLGHTQSNSEPTAQDYDALEVEKDNILSAIDWAFSLEDWDSVQALADVFAGPVSGMLGVHGYWEEAIRTNELALKAARIQASQDWIAVVTHNLAVMHQNRGELDEARRLYDESLAIARKLGDQSGIASTLHQLAWLAHNQGDLDEARRLYDESLAINQKLGNQSGIAITLHQLAMLAEDQGEVAEARRLYDESLAIARKLGDQSGIAITLHQLAMLAQAQGEVDEARRLYDESLAIKKKLGDQSGIAITLHQLALLAQAQGEVDEARRLYDESLAIARKLGDQSGIASTLHQLALLAQNQGEVDEARRLYDESLAIARKLGNQSGIAITLHQLAWQAQNQGEVDEARRLYDDSLAIEKKLGNQSGIASSLHQLGRLAEDEGDHAKAAEFFAEALAIFEKLESPNAEIARRSLARVQEKLKQRD